VEKPRGVGPSVGLARPLKAFASPFGRCRGRPGQTPLRKQPPLKRRAARPVPARAPALLSPRMSLLSSLSSRGRTRWCGGSAGCAGPTSPACAWQGQGLCFARSTPLTANASPARAWRCRLGRLDSTCFAGSTSTQRVLGRVKVSARRSWKGQGLCKTFLEGSRSLQDVLGRVEFLQCVLCSAARCWRQHAPCSARGGRTGSKEVCSNAWSLRPNGDCHLESHPQSAHCPARGGASKHGPGAAPPLPLWPGNTLLTQSATILQTKNGAWLAQTTL